MIRYLQGGRYCSKCLHVFQPVESTQRSHSADEQSEVQRGQAAQGHTGSEGQSWSWTSSSNFKALALNWYMPLPPTGYHITPAKPLHRYSTPAEAGCGIHATCTDFFFFLKSRQDLQCFGLFIVFIKCVPTISVTVFQLSGTERGEEFRHKERHSPKGFSKPSCCPGNRLRLCISL